MGAVFLPRTPSGGLHPDRTLARGSGRSCTAGGSFYLGRQTPYSVRSAQPLLEIDQCIIFFNGFVAGFRPWPVLKCSHIILKTSSSVTPSATKSHRSVPTISVQRKLISMPSPLFTVGCWNGRCLIIADSQGIILPRFSLKSINTPRTDPREDCHPDVRAEIGPEARASNR